MVPCSSATASGPVVPRVAKRLFAWTQQSIRVPFADLPPVEWKERGADIVNKSEFLAYLRQTAIRYESVESAPHEPPMTGHFYIHPAIPNGNPHALDELLKRFHPATKEDGLLIGAYLMTLLWGGPYGQRPAFLFTGENGDAEMGRGIGENYSGPHDRETRRRHVRRSAYRQLARRDDSIAGRYGLFNAKSNPNR